MHAATSASRSIASPPAVDPPQHHKERVPQSQSKHAIKPHLCGLLRRTPTRTPTTRPPNCGELARDLRDTLSSCCWSRCTCPRMMSGPFLMRMCHCSTSSSTQQHQHHAASPASRPSNHHSTTKTQSASQSQYAHACDQAAPVVSPPAKNIKPVGKVAEDKFDRSIPSIIWSHGCAFVMGHMSKINASIIMVEFNY
jgi:hypothetical protein